MSYPAILGNPSEISSIVAPEFLTGIFPKFFWIIYKIPCKKFLEKYLKETRRNLVRNSVKLIWQISRSTSDKIVILTDTSQKKKSSESKHLEKILWIFKEKFWKYLRTLPRRAKSEIPRGNPRGFPGRIPRKSLPENH